MTTRRHQRRQLIAASPQEVFAFIDDHARFSSHVSESSRMMGGGHTVVELDEAKGQVVGSHIRLSGRVFGLRLYLDEVVARRDPPSEKVWETVGTPRLLVIGTYKMGVHISPEHLGCQLRVFIDYELPTGWATYWLGVLFGGGYARWCVAQMLSSASTHFSSGA